MSQYIYQPTSFLLGHAAPVVTLANRGWMLASGSEDKTCRIWDLRTDRVHKALKGFDSTVSSISFTPADDHTVFVASSNKVYSFDLRMESLLLDTALAIRVYEGAEDEINQIQVNHRARYLIACDDAGDVRILDLKTHEWMRHTRRVHDNIAMTAQFVANKDLQAFSGGMDKLIVAWDFYKGRAIQIFDTDPQPDPSATHTKQLFNPPFVHSIAAHPSGTRIAVGLGDGSIQFLHTPTDLPTSMETEPDPNSQAVGSSNSSSIGTSKKTKNKSKKGTSSSSGSNGEKKMNWLMGGRLSHAHSSPIASIEYAGFNPNWLVTSSNTGSIAIWDDQASRFKTVQQLEQQRNILPNKESAATAAASHRALQPLQEFSTRDVFERVNCILTYKSQRDVDVDGGDGDITIPQKMLFVAGTHPRVGDKKLQGRIAVYHL